MGENFAGSENNMVGSLIGVAIQELPNAIQAIKDAFHKKHPDEPEPTEAEVLVAFESAFTSSRAKDEAWLSAHPEGTA